MIMADDMSAAARSLRSWQTTPSLPPTRGGLAAAYFGAGLLGSGFLLFLGSGALHRRAVSPKLLGCSIVTMAVGILVIGLATFIDHRAGSN